MVCGLSINTLAFGIDSVSCKNASACFFTYFVHVITVRQVVSGGMLGSQQHPTNTITSHAFANSTQIG